METKKKRKGYLKLKVFELKSPTPYDKNDVLVINGCRQAIQLIKRNTKGTKFQKGFSKALDSKFWYDKTFASKNQGKCNYYIRLNEYFMWLPEHEREKISPYTFFTRKAQNNFGYEVPYRSSEIISGLNIYEAKKYKVSCPEGFYKRIKPANKTIFNLCKKYKIYENDENKRKIFDEDYKNRHYYFTNRKFDKTNLPLLIVQSFNTNKSISFVDYDVLPPKFNKWEDFKRHLILQLELLGLNDCCVVLESPSNKVKLAIAVEIPEGVTFTTDIRWVLTQKFLSKIPYSFGYAPYLDFRAGPLTRCFMTREIYQKLQKFETRAGFTTPGYTEGWFKLLPEELPANDFINYHSKKLKEDPDFIWDYSGKIPSFVRTPKNYEGIMRYIKPHTKGFFEDNPLQRIQDIFQQEYSSEEPACFEINPELFLYCIDFNKLTYELEVKNFYINSKFNVNLTINHFMPQHKNNHKDKEVLKFKDLLEELLEVDLPFLKGIPVLKKIGKEVKLGYLPIAKGLDKHNQIFESVSNWFSITSEQRFALYLEWKLEHNQRETLFMSNNWQNSKNFKENISKPEKSRKDWKFDSELDNNLEYQELTKNLDKTRKHVLDFIMSCNKEEEGGFRCDRKYISSQIYKQFGYYMCAATVGNSLLWLESLKILRLSGKKRFFGDKHLSNLYSFTPEIRLIYDKLFKVRVAKQDKEFSKNLSKIPLWIKEKRVEDGMWYTKMYRATNYFSSEEEFFEWAFSIPGCELKNREHHIRNSWNYHAHLNDLYSSGPPILVDLKQRKLAKLAA